MENDEGNEFGKQFAGSAAANVVFVLAMVIYKFVEGRCKHSRCSSNTSWFKCNVDNYETERSKSNKTKDAVQSEKSVPKMQARDGSEISPRHQALANLELRDPESLSGHTPQPKLVVGPELI